MALCAILTVFSGVSWAQNGITYRFRADTLVGQVWVVGDNARRELEAGEAGLATGRIEIWRDGGRQVFILNPADRTYYEENAYRKRMGVRQVSVDPLTVRRPFRVDGVENLHVDLKVLPRAVVVSGYTCRTALLTFSYGLELGLEAANVSMPGRVEGSLDVCLMEAPGTVRLPFGHGLEVTSGHPLVDAAIAERLTALKGIPVTRVLKATRWIERGEPVSGMSAFILSDIREIDIASDRFDVPKEYRFREPELVPPVRRHP
ncbi:MAG TPA: hypothetical protein VLD67_10410 [Vicinamibacterales bacterium]|nr:hypothetical protein [Vicinamibacterales bacterium]